MEKQNKVDDGGPAFPAPDAGEHEYGSNNRGVYPGMSLRDYFAAQAMQGWLATFVNADPKANGVADFAYRVADAMLKARSA